jgi:hypothetical protein
VEACDCGEEAAAQREYAQYLSDVSSILKIDPEAAKKRGRTWRPSPYTMQAVAEDLQVLLSGETIQVPVLAITPNDEQAPLRDRGRGSDCHKGN